MVRPVPGALRRRRRVERRHGAVVATARRRDDAGVTRPDGPLQTVDLGGGRQLVVRPARADDAAAVAALYERLSADDRRLRFFAARPPGIEFVEGWVRSAERGGLDLVVEVVDAGHGRPDATLVAEAGYALLPNGDGELGITIDPRWRGWLGPWLLDVLAFEAASRGVGNLEADVLVRNRNMMTVARHRGHAVIEHPDWEVVRLVMATRGRTPGWPPRPTGPRLLVAAPGGRWSGEEAARRAGFDVRICPGPDGPRPRCPALDGHPCPLVEGADALVVALPPDDPRTERLLAEHRRRHPGLVVEAPADDPATRSPCETAAAVVDRIRGALEAEDDPGRA
jgi:hypothetical protein